MNRSLVFVGTDSSTSQAGLMTRRAWKGRKERGSQHFTVYILPIQIKSFPSHQMPLCLMLQTASLTTARYI